jgi:hypothetical protein
MIAIGLSGRGMGWPVGTVMTNIAQNKEKDDVMDNFIFGGQKTAVM